MTSALIWYAATMGADHRSQLAQGLTADPACPRCGYDLAGQADAFQTRADDDAACPLRGTCAECGLEFAWREVYRPLDGAPRWSFEHASRALWWALVRSALRAFAPWHLWRRLRMEHPVVPARLATLALLGLLVNWAACAALASMAVHVAVLASRWRSRPSFGAPSQWTTDLMFAAWPSGQRLDFWGVPARVDLPSWWHAWVWLAWLLTPLALWLLPQTLRRCKVRPAHTLRLSAYALVALPLTLLAPVVAHALSHVLRNLARSTWNSGHFPGLSNDLFRLANALEIAFTDGIASCAGFAFLLLFWGFAASRYLKLPRPWLVAVVMVVIAGLASLLPVTLLGGLGIMRLQLDWL